MDKRNEYTEELRSQVYRTIQEDQRFYIHYSALAIGLLMTLQVIESGKNAIYGPFSVWLTAILAFGVSLLMNGPVCYAFDEIHYASMTLEMMKDGAIGPEPKMAVIAATITWTGRIAFFVGCIASVIYFVCQRLAASAC